MSYEELQKRIDKLNKRIKIDTICLHVLEAIMVLLIVCLLFIISE